MPDSIPVWRRLVSASQVDPWMERLVWVGRERIVIRTLPGKKRAALEVYCRSQEEAETCRDAFGGEIRQLATSSWMPGQDRKFCLFIPGVCCVIAPGTPVPDRIGEESVIEIPAALAFGTGEHATTSMCLRQLIRPPSGRALLDAGTGSGILALAAAANGYQVTAIDNDPGAIGEARKNARRNPHIPKIAWKVGDTTALDRRQRVDRILANLFLGVFKSALPGFDRILRDDGDLICSGILAFQEPDFRKLLHENGFQVDRRLRKGKWLCLVARKHQ